MQLTSKGNKVQIRQKMKDTLKENELLSARNNCTKLQLRDAETDLYNVKFLKLALIGHTKS